MTLNEFKREALKRRFVMSVGQDKNGKVWVEFEDDSYIGSYNNYEKILQIIDNYGKYLD